MGKWATPIEINDATMAFPANVTGTILPPIEDIPEDFHRLYGTKWNKIVSRWFYNGLPEGTEFKARDGIDTDIALRQLGACLGSYQPKHEHKEAGVAYLMSLFFEDVILPKEA